jgi:hypothetical protein
MAEQNIGETASTDQADQNTSQVEVSSRSYTQAEVDDMMARMKGSLSKKLLKPYEDLVDQQIKRGEFEKTLADLAAKKDTEISKRDNVIKEYKVNTPLLNAAAKYKSVNPDQVKSLLSSNLRLGEDGEVEVLDSKGSVRYTDSGTPLNVDDLVREFLDSNPHFVQATASTSHTKSSFVSEGGKLDVSKLDMKNPTDRKRYAEAKAQGKL